MNATKMVIALATGVFLAVGAGAVDPVSATSPDADLDTRSISAIAALDNEDLDTRSYTVDWSEMRSLNTKKIVGTMLLIR